MFITDTLHTVDVYEIKDLLSHKDTDRINDSYHDSSLTDESLEDFLFNTYKNIQCLCYVYHRKSCVYEDDMTIDYFSEDISHSVYYVDSSVCVKVC